MPRRYFGGYISSSKIPTEPFLTQNLSGIFSLTEVEAMTASGNWPTYIYIPPGEIEYTTPGTYSFIPPEDYYVSVICVGSGGGGRTFGYGASGGGGGGGLGYKNNIALYASQPYTVVVGAVPSGGNGGDSYFISPTLVMGGGGLAAPLHTGGPYVGDGGGNGGNSSPAPLIGGGGAGGYAGNGGNAGSAAQLSSGAGGGGGPAVAPRQFGGGGGGVGIYKGQGAKSGLAGATVPAPSPGLPAFQGGGGSDGEGLAQTTNGGKYGGGAGGNTRAPTNTPVPGTTGAVRILWGGRNIRSFPNTLSEKIAMPGTGTLSIQGSPPA